MIIEVPKDLLMVISKLYERVYMKLSSTQLQDIRSTIEVIQVYPFFLALFSIFIDEVEQYLVEFGGDEIKFRIYIIKTLMYVDDIIFISHDIINL